MSKPAPYTPAVIQALREELRETRHALASLEARIFRDGGHRTYDLGGPVAAWHEAEAEVVKMLSAVDELARRKAEAAESFKAGDFGG